ncbi:CaiB/BaiF CoA transferase family protein [Ruixingdingia sedimenti]|uniref:CoA transferase n=1 Tax=Ruixingdingia sedimenti TaxID=3073604 RepID=A0ABU1FEP7_9RHOB|nr:CoA transferase [Xinfangfangia sp. LG-4]MDR5655355.1 CoA transferase [Xinfangfangia sp. LG-4]
MTHLDTAATGLSAMIGLRPLEGIRVLTVENFLAAPYCSMWLADAGAEVVKVENREGGDMARQTSPVKHDAEGNPRGLSLLRASRNKKSLTLDLKHPEGKAIFTELAREADIVVENLRAGVMDRLGLGYAELSQANPRLIYVAISGFGQKHLLPSPCIDAPAFDIVGQALSGLMNRPERTGDRPTYLGFSLADIEAGILGAYGATLALIQRGRTGKGQLIDISLYDACLILNEISVAMYSGQKAKSAPGLHAVTAPFGSYRTKDGHIVIAVLGEHIWHRFCAAIGMPGLKDDPRFRDGLSRSRENAALTDSFAPWLMSRTRAEALEALLAAGVPAAAVNDVEDIFDCPHVAARQMLVTLDDPAWGPVQVVGNPVKMSGVPPVEARLPPALGEHTAEVLESWLGLDPARIAGLRARRVV